MESRLRIRLASFLGASLSILLATSSVVSADEVDDVLALKVRNRDRVRRFSGEFTVDTRQPSSVHEPKAFRFRYRMSVERVDRTPGVKPSSLWRMEVELLEPGRARIRVEGDSVSLQRADGTWEPQEMPGSFREQFDQMSERFLGADPGEQRKHFGIKVLRRNNPIFGPRTRTLEFVPRGKVKLFERLEEDISDDGLVRETRLYDAAGRAVVKARIKSHRKINSIPIMEAMEAVTETPAGQIVCETTCSDIRLEAEP